MGCRCSKHRKLEWGYRRDKMVGWRWSMHRELEWRYTSDIVVGSRYSNLARI